MKVKARQCGLTLMEMTVVIAVMALLAVFGLPAIRALLNSFESEGGAKCMISAALASGRAIAAKEHHYAGIRFQKAYDPNDPDLLNAAQYMIFIVHDFGATGLAPGFRAVEGIKPIKLPGNVGVMEVVNDDDEIDDVPSGEFTDKTTFSIVFSPSGKLVIHDVRTRNRDGRTAGTETVHISKDDIFNTESKVTDPVKPFGMFIQDDDYASFPGLKEEPSRRSFIIYNKSEFNKVDINRRWSDYLEDLANSMIYINPYTGTMIKK